MKIHYAFSSFHRYTACGLPVGPYQVTHNQDETTCGSCQRCFGKYMRHQQEVIEKTKHLSNEEVLNRVIENLVPASYFVPSEFTDIMQVLLSRLTETGFISNPNKIWVDLYYI